MRTLRRPGMESYLLLTRRRAIFRAVHVGKRESQDMSPELADVHRRRGPTTSDKCALHRRDRGSIYFIPQALFTDTLRVSSSVRMFQHRLGGQADMRYKQDTLSTIASSGGGERSRAITCSGRKPGNRNTILHKAPQQTLPEGRCTRKTGGRDHKSMALKQFVMKEQRSCSTRTSVNIKAILSFARREQLSTLPTSPLQYEFSLSFSRGPCFSAMRTFNPNKTDLPAPIDQESSRARTSTR